MDPLSSCHENWLHAWPALAKGADTSQVGGFCRAGSSQYFTVVVIPRIVAIRARHATGHSAGSVSLGERKSDRDCDVSRLNLMGRDCPSASLATQEVGNGYVCLRTAFLFPTYRKESFHSSKSCESNSKFNVDRLPIN